MQVEQFGILLQVKSSFKKYLTASFGYSEVYCIVVVLSMVFFVEF